MVRDQWTQANAETYESTHDAVAEVVIAAAPWALSTLLHAGVVLLSIFLVYTTVRKVDEIEPVVPAVVLTAKPGVPISHRSAQPIQNRSHSSDRVRSIVAAPGGRASLIGSGGGEAGDGGGTSGLTGVAGGQGRSRVSPGSPFDNASREAGRFSSMFFGTEGGNARRVGYLIDASGSLIDTLPFVVMELKRSIAQLSDEQSFCVVFFQGEEVVEVPPLGMTRATKEHKQAVMAWLDERAGNVVPMGATTPLAALQRSLRYQPDLLYVLSDNITGAGRFEVDQRRLLREIDATNRRGTRINTIQFVYPDPLAQLGMKSTMQLIAERTRGEYKFLDGRELGIW